MARWRIGRLSALANISILLPKSYGLIPSIYISICEAAAEKVIKGRIVVP